MSQRAAWVLVPRPLNYRLSDAVSTHVALRNAGAFASGPIGVLAAYGSLSSSLAMDHHAWMQANALSQSAAEVLVPRPLIDSVSDAYRWSGGAENTSHLFRGQLGCLQRMGH